MQLKQVLKAVGMKVEEEGPALTFPDRGVLVKAAKGEDIGVGEGAIWEEEREGIYGVFERLVGMMGEPVGEKGMEGA